MDKVISNIVLEKTKLDNNNRFIPPVVKAVRFGIKTEVTGEVISVEDRSSEKGPWFKHVVDAGGDYPIYVDHISEMKGAVQFSAQVTFRSVEGKNYTNYRVRRLLRQIELI